MKRVLLTRKTVPRCSTCLHKSEAQKINKQGQTSKCCDARLIYDSIQIKQITQSTTTKTMGKRIFKQQPFPGGVNFSRAYKGREVHAIEEDETRGAELFIFSNRENSLTEPTSLGFYSTRYSGFRAAQNLIDNNKVKQR